MRRRGIDPGALRTPFSLQEATPLPDGAGGHTLEWSEVTTVFGRLEPVSAQSRFGADQAIVTVSHDVTMRRRDDVRSGMRLVFGARVLTIVTVHDPDGTGRYTLLPDTGGGAMRIAMKLTLDGLVRALRTRAHDIADGHEIGHSARVAGPNREVPKRTRRPRKGPATGGGDGRTRA